jgi:chlorophyllide a reductase subunit Z
LQTELTWAPEAKAALDRLLESEPVLVRISAAKRLRDAAERIAREAGDERVVSEDDLAHAHRTLTGGAP